MKSANRFRAALAVVLSLCGCRETTPSDYVSTGQIAALIDFTAESAESAGVRVELRAGGADSETYVVLHSGDTLRASAKGETKELRASAEGVYEGTLGAGGEAELVVTFDREKHEDAPASSGTLPAPFELESPAGGEVLSRAKDDLVIAWSPAASTSGRVAVSGPCISAASFEVTAGAMGLIVEGGDLEASDGDADDECDVEVVMTLTRAGSADPAFEEGSRVRAHQVRRVSFRSAP